MLLCASTRDDLSPGELMGGTGRECDVYARIQRAKVAEEVS